MKRPFAVHYNPDTQTIDVLDTAEKLLYRFRTLKAQVDHLYNAMTILTNLRTSAA